jgi:Domain of unknown function (DUF5753)
LIRVIDEAMPHRVVGGPAVMAEQLDCLVEAARLPNVTVFRTPDGRTYLQGRWRYPN